MWLSLVERYVRDVEVAGSNPVISTKYKRDGCSHPFCISPICQWIRTSCCCFATAIICAPSLHIALPPNYARKYRFRILQSVLIYVLSAGSCTKNAPHFALRRYPIILYILNLDLPPALPP